MPKKTPNHNADIKNANKGTKGTNVPYAKAQGARGKHLNPNQNNGVKSTPKKSK